MENLKKRIKVHGHYRVVEWDEKGRFISVKKWSSKKMKNRKCPRCEYWSLVQAGEIDVGKVWLCKRCGYREIKNFESVV